MLGRSRRTWTFIGVLCDGLPPTTADRCAAFAGHALCAIAANEVRRVDSCRTGLFIFIRHATGAECEWQYVYKGGELCADGFWGGGDHLITYINSEASQNASQHAAAAGDHGRRALHETAPAADVPDCFENHSCYQVGCGGGGSKATVLGGFPWAVHLLRHDGNLDAAALVPTTACPYHSLSDRCLCTALSNDIAAMCAGQDRRDPPLQRLADHRRHLLRLVRRAVVTRPHSCDMAVHMSSLPLPFTAFHCPYTIPSPPFTADHRRHLLRLPAPPKYPLPPLQTNTRAHTGRRQRHSEHGIGAGEQQQQGHAAQARAVWHTGNRPDRRC